MTALHTPGPWEVAPGESITHHWITPVAGAGGGWVGGRYMAVSGQIDIHDARLIAAAPDLLAALQAAVAAGIIDINGEPDAARAAIARATGTAT